MCSAGRLLFDAGIVAGDPSALSAAWRMALWRGGAGAVASECETSRRYTVESCKGPSLIARKRAESSVAAPRRMFCTVVVSARAVLPM